MSEQIKNKKSAQEEFLVSEKYTALKKEAEADNKDISQVRTEKLFWETVTENIKESDFRNIYETIRLDIENRNYILARQVLNQELKKIISKISPLIYGNNDKRSSAFVTLKGEFYKLFPVIEALLEETEEEKRAKVKIPTGQLGKEEETPSPPGGEFREPLRDPYLLEEKKWKVPKYEELIRGLIIIFWHKETNRSEKMEFLEWPKKGENGDFFVKVKWSGKIGLINLADFGLIAYAQTGLWNSHYIPQHWEIKEESK